MEAQQTADPAIPITVKVRESIIRRLKHRGVDERRTMSAIVEEILDRALREPVRRAAGKREPEPD